ncbi:MAG TPA: hypothetical protein ACFYED_07345 [Candidatus Tripitaka californicus]|uniref:hypothetical protein n=2 Tax=Candidatus Tripitaka californicus TaxID=3367616 RepID=UPI004025F77D
MGKVRCPGSLKTTAPTIVERRCPKCGRTVEMFGDEEKTECKCGNTVFKDRIPTCVEWCKAAEECLGDVIDVKKIKEEAKKRAEKEGDPQFVSKLGELFKKKQQDCEENQTK